MADTTIAMRDDGGVLRRIIKIMPMSDGVAVSVPYHTANEGWLFSDKPKYDRLVYESPLSNHNHFTARDLVKLSIHFSGFVQFSSGGRSRILSGYDAASGTVKGLGVKAPQRIHVTSGPLFGVVVRGISDFRLLGSKKALIFEKDDRWYHPHIDHAEANSFNFEFFMFPRHRMSEVISINGERVLRTELPFVSFFAFRFDLRVIELQDCDFFLGAIVHPFCSSDTASGYVLSSPSCGPPGEERTAIFACYPKPDFITDAQPLDFDPSSAD